MASLYTTEITSSEIASDNPIHQRLYKAYVIAKDQVRGHVLEVGCGDGRGVADLLPAAEKFTAVDKIESVISMLKRQYPTGEFIAMNIPPLGGLEDNKYDFVVSFQVIEHIDNDLGYLREIYRVMKPGATLLLTTPNRALSLSRNPWHVREYLPEELKRLAEQVFDQVEMKGIAGNEKVMVYHEENRKSVNRLMRFDIFNLQYRLPAAILRIPYEVLNRWNRNKLNSSDGNLVSAISHEDYFLTDKASEALDLFVVATKA